MPANVLNNGLRSWIENHRDAILTPDQIAAISESLAHDEKITDRKVAARAHVVAIHERNSHAKTRRR